MKFTLSWLADHLETRASAAEIAETLTAIGLEVEAVEDRGAALAGFVVGRVVDARPHPGADRLRLCTVDAGAGGRFDVVCGAPNARAGMNGVFAPVGARIPATGRTLEAARIRGVESRGMLCSGRELGLSDDHDGIVDLAGDFPAGSPAAAALGLDDPVIEIGLTPNRADCAGVRGIARDLAAAGQGNLKPLDLSPVPGAFESPVRWKRSFAGGAHAACPFVVGRCVRGVVNGPGPQWLRDRLTAIGLRPISALVDITNYVTFDLGRPLHVFDTARIDGDLTMRLARPGERLAALDGRDYALDETMTVIADARGPVAIGGVMGGAESGCGPETTDVFVESALFDPARTAATGRKLGIASDARYRFERGVDPASAAWGAEIAARLILEICGGEASAATRAGEEPRPRRRIGFDAARIAALGGVEMPGAEAADILRRLGFEVEDGGGALAVTVPSWRADVDGEADLVEEVLRIRGFDAIPAMPLRAAGAVPPPPWSPAQARRGLVRRRLAAQGLVEAVTFSFMSGRRAGPFADGAAALALANPISAELDVMRPSILPNLLDAAERNAARGIPDVGLFEIGPQFAPGPAADAAPESASQRVAAAGIRVGAAVPRHWSGAARPADAYDAKADALAALAAAGAPAAGLRTEPGAPPWYHPGRSGALVLGRERLAWFGELHPSVLAGRGLDGAVGFEAFIDSAPQARARSARPAPDLPDLQPVVRDFAFVVDEEVPAADVLSAARGAEKTLIGAVSLFDVYRGAELGAGRKSLALTVTLQPRETTLTDAEIEAVGARIAAAVARRCGGRLRG